MKLPRHYTTDRSTAKKRADVPPPPPELVGACADEPVETISIVPVAPDEESVSAAPDRGATAHDELASEDEAETLRQQLSITRDRETPAERVVVSSPGAARATSSTSVQPKTPSSRPLPPPPPPRLRTPVPGSARVPLPPLPSSVPPPVTRSVRPPPAPREPYAAVERASPSLPRPSVPKPKPQSAPLVLDLGEADFARAYAALSEPSRSSPNGLPSSASDGRLETPQMMASTLPPRASATDTPVPQARRGGALTVVVVGALMLLVGAGGFALGTGYQSRAVVHVVASKMDGPVELEPEPAAPPAESSAPSVATASVATAKPATAPPPVAHPPKIAPPATPPAATHPAAPIAAAPKTIAPKPQAPPPTVGVAAAPPPTADGAPYAGEAPPKTSAVVAPDDPTHGVTSAGF